MNAYDFDNTIYDGESLFDFFIFCMYKKKSLILYFPFVLYILVLYKTHFVRQTTCLGIALSRRKA